MKFTINFQPIGIRLICDEPLTALEAAREAGIQLRADCGGKGTCGKCMIRVSDDYTKSPSAVERNKLAENLLSKGYRLACETIADNDIQIFIPPQSLLEGQVLQTEGLMAEITPKPAVSSYPLKLEPATLNDLRSDVVRIKDKMEKQYHKTGVQVPFDILPSLSQSLRENDWQINLLVNNGEIINSSKTSPEKLLGLAVDVGSTKIACYLLDLQSGKVLATKGAANPQIAFGEDIMTRLEAILRSSDNAIRLQEDVIETINQISSELCSAVSADQSEIMDFCLVGNTAMHHFSLKLPSQSLATSPFVPVTNLALNIRASSIHLNGMPGAKVFVPPVLAGFVGSDHLAFLYASGFGKGKRTRLGIDIGTNTEIALQHGGRIVSCSTASGPAFEGAHIRFGMRAASGAIEHVSITKDGNAKCEVIGNKTAIGICGSGILDTIAELHRNHITNSRGRLDKSHKKVKLEQNGIPAFVLLAKNENQQEITISQHDIDQILLAKGAIRAGADILMDHLQVNPREIEDVVIAGAFGSYMNPEHAISIGMLPTININKVHTVGNAAGTGARMMLISTTARKEACQLAGRIEYLELTTYPDFALFFANGIRSSS
ncbi:MAG TPA: DUF4445 domain-containing protein [Anaerolineae bacterium]|nr:DUF4445 domain-containing protein [Anaerolineae bacterium]